MRRSPVFGFELLEDRVVPAAYFVSPSGVDGAGGGTTQPWQTIQYAATHVHAGDSVTVRAGDYAGFDLFTSGTSASRITFTGEAGARITTQNPRTPDGINLEGASYVTVEGFTITGIPRAGIRSVENTGVVIRNNTSDQNGVWGIFTGFSENLTIQGNVTSRSGQQHGIYVSNSADNPVIRGNVSWGNYGCGIHMNGDASMGGDGIISNALVENNVLYSNGAGGGSSINADGVQNSIFRNNLIYDAKAAGISLFQIDGGGGSSNNQVVNNTVLVNSSGRWALSISDGSTGNVVRNNILYSAQSFRGAISVTADSLLGLVSDYNLTEDRYSIDGGDTALSLAQWQTAVRLDAHSLTTADPSSLFVNAAGGDYHLKAGSAAIDRGTTVGAPPTDSEGTTRPQGAGVDIGHDELAVSPPPVSPSPAGPLYTDDFAAAALNPAWSAVGGSWGVNGGAVSQTSTDAGDPKKLLLTGVTTPAAVRVTARVRVNGWQSGDYARVGVGIYTDPVTGQGYNLLFRDGGKVQFLDDYRAWGNSASFNWQVGQWYWFTLEADEAGNLSGKVWADGTPEPTNWTVQQTGWTGRCSGGAVALHGGSSGTGYATASFDDVIVTQV